MIYENIVAEQKAIIQVAYLMLAAARTAPKGCGIDNIEAMIVDGKEKDILSAEMRRIAVETNTDFFDRDAGNVDASAAVVLIGVKNSPILLDNCSLCGFENCAETKKAGANCAFNITDLGIAIGSATSIAADNRIDNRIMFSGGKAALSLKYFSEDVRVGYAIPLSTYGKSVFYDRSPDNRASK